jgi:diguanylate cyclase (GGDEF)-like protein
VPASHDPETGQTDGLAQVLDRLMPLHLVVGADGCIDHCGPTLAKLVDPGTLAGQPFLEAFTLRRPRDAFSFVALRAQPFAPLRLTLARDDALPMRGILAPLPDGRTLVNLSFGIALVDAVARYRLTADDFATTDLAVEMLYLVEAQSAAFQESRKLNARLDSAKIAAEEQAFTDTLTGLKNRRAMVHVVERLVRSHVHFAILLVDLDYFKDVNDSLGHAAGDHVLQAVARALMDEVRPGDTVVRIGGDEFAVIACDMRDPAAALSLGRRIVQRVEQPVPFAGHVCRISASIGIALSATRPRATFDELMAAADATLYEVKSAGRANAAVAVPDDGSAGSSASASAADRRSA